MEIDYCKYFLDDIINNVKFGQPILQNHDQIET